MWRISGFVGRVVSRCHGHNSSLRLTNGHHVEDEVISSSTVLSTNWSQRGEDGEQNKKNKRTAEFYSAGLPRYTALDAVGWGAAAVLFMQLCKRIHSQFSSVGDQNPGPSCRPESGLIHKCTHRILLNMLCSRDVLPRGACLVGVKGAPSSPEQSNSSGVHNYSVNTQPAPTSSDQQEETLSDDFTEESLHEFDAAQSQPCGSEEPHVQRSLTLEEAEQKLKDVADKSVPIVLNIMGLESAKAGDNEAAFEFFLASAQQNYSKAQFNVGVCYERGQGVHKDLNKALRYYRAAADAGHTQAQYRCAKLLLNCRGQQSAPETHTATAISLLRSAATAGLAQAQLYLGVVFSEVPDADGVESVQYFRMAAQSGDSTGLLFMGQCYERGFGVPQCYRTAVRYYELAASKGNQKARDILRDLHCREVLRSIRSAPCLSVPDGVNLNAMFSQVYQEAGPSSVQLSDRSTQPLAHSWSTGSLVAPPHLFSHPLNSNGKSGGWIIGVG